MTDRDAGLQVSASDRRDPLGLVPLPADNRQQFLRFTLDRKDDMLLPLGQILEVMQRSLDDIFPVPDMPESLLGVCSWKGETLWLVDLNHLLGKAPLYQQPQLVSAPFIMVIQAAERTLGLVVEAVGDIDRFDGSELHVEQGLCSPDIDPFVLGYCPHQQGIVLDASKILSSPLWQSHV